MEKPKFVKGQRVITPFGPGIINYIRNANYVSVILDAFKKDPIYVNYSAIFPEEQVFTEEKK